MNASFIFFALITFAAAVPYAARETCSTSADCLHGFPATVATLKCSVQGYCVPIEEKFCASSNDCPALTTCHAGSCVHGAERLGCARRADCGIGLWCNQGSCTHGRPGDSCSIATAVECANGLTCDQRKCTPGVDGARCVLDRNCAGSHQCEEGICRKGTRESSAQFHQWQAHTRSVPPMRPDTGSAVSPVGSSATAASVLEMVENPTVPERVVPGAGLEREMVAASAQPFVEIIPVVTSAPRAVVAADFVVPEPTALPAAVVEPTSEPHDLHRRAFRAAASSDVGTLDVFATNGPLATVVSDNNPPAPVQTTQTPHVAVESTQVPSVLVLHAPFKHNVVATPVVVPVEVMATVAPSPEPIPPSSSVPNGNVQDSIPAIATPEVIAASFSHAMTVQAPAPATTPEAELISAPYAHSAVEVTTAPMASPEPALISVTFSHNAKATSDAVPNVEDVLPTAIPIPMDYPSSSSGQTTLSLTL